ncbi:MAG TPA: succinylglutamate desuccinylase/aspartoacylase family protein, partial [Planctomycetota bacterium]|nr:succinylglutamate desuccinylase/aspartoacylase family protein [Planctomycetota bacterium]
MIARFLILGAFLGVSLSLLVAPSTTEALGSHVLLPGTRFETPVWVVDGASSGPTVLITGGVHGNEIAGALAAMEMSSWPIRRGRLVIVPRANVPALDAGTRATPFEPEDLADLNRNFPRQEGDDPRGALAGALWKLVLEVEPDWILDLHEGYGFARTNDDTVGSSIIADPRPEVVDVARRLVATVNAEIEEASQRFVLKRNPVLGSLARAAIDRLQMRAMILETTTKERLSVRVRQHRVLVRSFLMELGMLDPESATPRFVREEAGRTRVALLDDDGADADELEDIARRLEHDHAFALRRVSRRDVRDGGLDGFDAIVVAGGRASVMGRAIGISGREAIERFVRGGGAFVGIGAGAYLATREYDWSLALVDANVESRSHWRRGVGEVAVSLTPRGAELFEDVFDPDVEWRYENGPILSPAGDPDIPDYVACVLYSEEIAEDDAPRGIMIESPALIVAELAKGRIAIFGALPPEPSRRAPEKAEAGAAADGPAARVQRAP